MRPKTLQNATVGRTASQFADYLPEENDLCREIAALDLASRPLYIVAQSQIASQFRISEGCRGTISPSLDFKAQEIILNWQGRGRGLVSRS